MDDSPPSGPPRLGTGVMKLILAGSVLVAVFAGSIFLFNFDDSHNHGVVMRIFMAVGICGMYVWTAFILVGFTDLEVDVPRGLWVGMWFPAVVMYAAGVLALSGGPWPLQWGIPLICLPPIYLVHLYTSVVRQLLARAREA